MPPLRNPHSGRLTELLFPILKEQFATDVLAYFTALHQFRLKPALFLKLSSTQQMAPSAPPSFPTASTLCLASRSSLLSGLGIAIVI
ncbi:hypothetical protein LINPERHAP1_LOCUS2183 [Linum perenne]